MPPLENEELLKTESSQRHTLEHGRAFLCSRCTVPHHDCDGTLTHATRLWNYRNARHLPCRVAVAYRQRFFTGFDTQARQDGD